MTRDDLGDYVLAEDYDALRNASEALQAENERLRQALSLALASLEISRPIDESSVAPHNRHFAAIEACRAAIAKATGEQQA